ncbi:DUF4956 domain-containing protein [Anaerofustis sp.]|uniref:DUF4956 domain-containing protein n=1 Tax=Anaerofustis sp. TaxID=1872517 RepID=UPI0025C05E4F|nr:DUF4956 domain-containing protein [Anaerofustis sp.]
MHSDFNDMMRNSMMVAEYEMSTMTLVKTLGFAAFLVILLFITYKIAHSSNSYQPKFAVTLVIMAFVSTILMDLIQSNLALSLGMLGSLSIVRFRTNITDPRDIGFIIWAMAIGLIASTMSFIAGLLGSVVLAVLMIISKKDDDVLDDKLLVVRGSVSDLDKIQMVVDSIGGSKVKAKNILSDSFELVYEVRISDGDSNIVIDNIFKIGGIDAVNLLSPTVV